MSDQIKKLRAITDFAEKHDVAARVSSVSVYHGPHVQLYERAEESAIESLLEWATALEATVVWVREVGDRFHLYVRESLPGLGKFEVVAITREAESQAIVAAGMYRRTDLPVSVAVMRKLITKSVESEQDTP